MKTRFLTIIGILGIFLSGCNMASKDKSKHHYDRYVVKLVIREESVRLGADGLTDEEFDKIVEGKPVIPGDVILIEKNDDLSVIDIMIEKQDMSKKYLVPVIKINDPTGLDWEKSKYLYDVHITSEWQNLHFGEYILKFDRKNDCVIKDDSSVNYIWQLPDQTKFYALFDASCCEKKDFTNSNGSGVVSVYYVRPLLFLLNKQ